MWDVPTRMFHWLLVASVATAAVTGFLLDARWISVHLTAGITATTLVLLRVVWGFMGPWPSRFAAFWPRPSDVLQHLRTLPQRHAAPHASHNPLGAVMVLALGLVVLSLGMSGLAIWGGLLKQGPLKAFLSFAAALPLREAHEALAWLVLLMVMGHLAGVAFESWRTKDNLALGMVTGTKRLPDEEAARLNRLTPKPQAAPQATPKTALAVIALGAAAVLAASVWAMRLPPQGVPPATLDPRYAEACGECHTPYHPSLLPAKSWQALLANLDDHFGEDASLPDADVQNLTRYLEANAAEHWDTLPAHAFRSATPAPYQRIFETPFWKARHAALPASLFESPQVKSRANCAACHTDAAAGVFAPQSITLPKEN